MRGYEAVVAPDHCGIQALAWAEGGPGKSQSRGLTA